MKKLTHKTVCWARNQNSPLEEVVFYSYIVGGNESSEGIYLCETKSGEKKRFDYCRPIENEKPTEALERVESYFQLKYNKSLNDMVITDVPGYWEDKIEGHYPNHPLSGCLGCGPHFKASYSYRDSFRDDRGRFASITRTWKLIYDYEKTN